MIMNDADYLVLGVEWLIFDLTFPDRGQKTPTSRMKVIKKETMDKLANYLYQMVEEQGEKKAIEFLETNTTGFSRADAKQSLQFFLLYRKLGYALFKELAVHLGSDYVEGTPGYGLVSALKVLEEQTVNTCGVDDDAMASAILKVPTVGSKSGSQSKIHERLRKARAIFDYQIVRTADNTYGPFVDSALPSHFREFKQYLGTKLLDPVAIGQHANGRAQYNRYTFHPTPMGDPQQSVGTPRGSLKGVDVSKLDSSRLRWHFLLRGLALSRYPTRKNKVELLKHVQLSEKDLIRLRFQHPEYLHNFSLVHKSDQVRQAVLKRAQGTREPKKKKKKVPVGFDALKIRQIERGKTITGLYPEGTTEKDWVQGEKMVQVCCPYLDKETGDKYLLSKLPSNSKLKKDESTFILANTKVFARTTKIKRMIHGMHAVFTSDLSVLFRLFQCCV